MTPIDPRLHALALELLTEATDTKTAKHYADAFARHLQDQVEDFLDNELQRLETDRDDAARDADDEARISEALGK